LRIALPCSLFIKDEEELLYQVFSTGNQAIPRTKNEEELLYQASSERKIKKNCFTRFPL
jgi:hypothetical protein